VADTEADAMSAKGTTSLRIETLPEGGWELPRLG
jgi:hypothetical protein